MGASLSNLTESAANGGAGPGLGDIPESCVACVFMYLTPPEICNLARLNRAFRGAASADTVWESKLPRNYPDLLDLLPAEIYRNICKKKDIFALLSRPVPFDGGTKVVWLDRVTGGVCVSVSAKAMAITGIEDRRYWSWIPTEESKEIKHISTKKCVSITRKKNCSRKCILIRNMKSVFCALSKANSKSVFCALSKANFERYIKPIFLGSFESKLGRWRLGMLPVEAATWRQRDDKGAGEEERI